MRTQRYYSGWWGIAFGAATVAAAGVAHALEASDVLVFSYGSLSLRPQFEVDEQYNDNIFYSRFSTRKIADFITVLAPGVRLLIGEDLPQANHFSMTGRLEQVLFAQNSDQNALQEKYSDNGYYEWSRLSVEGHDRVEWLSSVLGAGVSNVPIKVDRMTWQDTYRLRYALGERTHIYGQLDHNFIDYKGQFLNLFDGRTLTGTGGFEYQFSGETHLFGEVYYGDTTLEPNAPGAPPVPGTTTVGGFVGARGKFTEKLTGLVKAGYGISEFTGAAPAGLDTSAGSSPVVDITLTYQATERMSLSFDYKRRQLVSVQYSRAAYVEDVISLRGSEVIGAAGRIRADLGVNYLMAGYDKSPTQWPNGRNDTQWSVDAGVSYYFQTWLWTRLGYSFESYSSDFTGVVDYDVNRVTLSLAVGY